jgi:hypothetical protein
LDNTALRRTCVVLNSFDLKMPLEKKPTRHLRHLRRKPHRKGVDVSHKHEGPSYRKLFDPHSVQFFVKIVRDIAIFVLGAYGFVHELQRSGAERPQILILSAAMMGLPLIIRGDEKRQEVRSNDDSKASDTKGT